MTFFFLLNLLRSSSHIIRPLIMCPCFDSYNTLIFLCLTYFSPSLILSVDFPPDIWMAQVTLHQFHVDEFDDEFDCWDSS